MRTFFTLSCIFCLACSSSFSQVQMDKALQMTGEANEDKQITGVGYPGDSDHAVNAANIQGGQLVYASSSFSTDTYSVTLNPVPGGYSPGMVVNFKAILANTGPVFLNVNGLGARSIKKQVVNPLASGDIAIGQMVSVIYDGSNFQLLSSVSNSSGATPTKKVFVTSTKYNGNLGGLSGADALCQLAATNGGLSGTFVAWLSTSTVNARDRISDAFYVRTDGAWVAVNRADMYDGVLMNPISRDEFGNLLSTGIAWTGTKGDGTPFQDYNCSGWTTTASPPYGGGGNVTNSTNQWTFNSGGQTCTVLYSLYCFEL